MKFYLLCIGELKPDFVSSRIQRYLSRKHQAIVNWSHCAIEVEGPGIPENERVWDSTGRGFEPGTLAEALDHGQAVARHRILLPVDDAAQALGWLRGFRGRGYSNLQYVPFLMPDWLRAIARKLIPAFIRWQFMNGRRRAVCSETIGYFIRDNNKMAGLNDKRLAEEAMDLLDPFVAYQVADAWEYFHSGSEG